MTVQRFLIQDSIDSIRVIATAGIGVARAATIAEELLELHADDTTDVHGIADTSVLATDAELAAAIAAHAADTTAVHGITDTSALETGAGAQARVDTHAADTTNVHGIADTSVLATDAELSAAVANLNAETAAAIEAHRADTTGVHGITDTSLLETTAGAQARVDTHAADTTAVHGIADTSVLATDADVTAAVDALSTVYLSKIAADAVEVDGTPIVAWDDEGHVWFGSDAGIDWEDGGSNLYKGPLAFRTVHVSGQEPIRLYTNGGISLKVTDEVPEFVLRRIAGKFGSDEDAFTTLAADIADVTALSGGQITLAEMGEAGLAWPTGDPRKVLIQQGAKQALVTYTGINYATSQLTGVTYVAGSAIGSTAYTASATTYVTRILLEGSGLGFIFAEAFTGRGGFQAPSARVSFELAEDAYPDGYGGYRLGGRINLVTASPGPKSQPISQGGIDADGAFLLKGSHLGDFDDVDEATRVTFTQASTIIDAGDTSTIPTPASTPFLLQVEDPSGFPAGGGTIEVNTSAGLADIAYTSVDVGDGVTVAAHGEVSSPGLWYFHGCTAASPTFDGATIADAANVNRAQHALGTGLAVLANISAHHFQGDASGHAGRTTTGAIGPTAALPEGGIMVGNTGNGEVTLYRAAANVWAMGNGDRLRGTSSTGADPTFASRVNGDAANRAEIRANGMIALGDGTTIGTIVKQLSAGLGVVRDGTDTADAKWKCSELQATGPLNHDGTTVGFYGTAPATQQAATTDADVHAALKLLGLVTGTYAEPTYQPVDADLTAIAALTTTAFGRALLALADAAALRSSAGLARTGNQDGAVRTADHRSLTGVTAPGAANRATYMRASGSQTGVTQLVIGIGTSSGNISVAVYANNGSNGTAARPTGARKATTGSIACPAGSALATVTLTGSVDIVDGDWVCITADNNTVTFLRGPALHAAAQGAGVNYYEETAHPAPATVGSLTASIVGTLFAATA